MRRVNRVPVLLERGPVDNDNPRRLNRIYNLDCMEAMKEIPDKFFQLAICDPPYGIGHDGQRERGPVDNDNPRRTIERRIGKFTIRL